MIDVIHNKRQSGVVCLSRMVSVMFAATQTPHTSSTSYTLAAYTHTHWKLDLSCSGKWKLWSQSCWINCKLWEGYTHLYVCSLPLCFTNDLSDCSHMRVKQFYSYSFQHCGHSWPAPLLPVGHHIRMTERHLREEEMRKFRFVTVTRLWNY